MHHRLQRLKVLAQVPRRLLFRQAFGSHFASSKRAREGGATRTCCTYASTAQVALCFICLNGNQSSKFFARQMAQKLNCVEQEIKLMVSLAWRVHVFTLCLRSTSEFLSHFSFSSLFTLRSSYSCFWSQRDGALQIFILSLSGVLRKFQKHIKKFSASTRVQINNRQLMQAKPDAQFNFENICRIFDEPHAR